MESGLTIYDEDGVVRLDAQTLVGRVLGNFSTGTANGSVTNPLMLQGTPYFFGFATNAPTGLVHCLPDVSISGSTISWVFRDFSVVRNAAARVPLSVVYGVM